MGGPKSKSKKCRLLPYFSNPHQIFDAEILGLPWKSDNNLWLKQNRFVLEKVGNETIQCPGYNDKIMKCLLSKPIDVDVNCSVKNMSWPWPVG